MARSQRGFLSKREDFRYSPGYSKGPIPPEVRAIFADKSGPWTLWITDHDSDQGEVGTARTASYPLFVEAIVDTFESDEELIMIVRQLSCSTAIYQTLVRDVQVVRTIGSFPSYRLKNVQDFDQRTSERDDSLATAWGTDILRGVQMYEQLHPNRKESRLDQSTEERGGLATKGNWFAELSGPTNLAFFRTLQISLLRRFYQLSCMLPVPISLIGIRKFYFERRELILRSIGIRFRRRKIR
jgi:hypothetical protein